MYPVLDIPLYDTAQALKAVLLITPADEAVLDDTTPTFTWSVRSGADTYDIQIASDSEFNMIVASATGLTETEFTPESSL